MKNYIFFYALTCASVLYGMETRQVEQYTTLYSGISQNCSLEHLKTLFAQYDISNHQFEKAAELCQVDKSATQVSFNPQTKIVALLQGYFKKFPQLFLISSEKVYSHELTLSQIEPEKFYPLTMNHYTPLVWLSEKKLIAGLEHTPPLKQILTVITLQDDYNLHSVQEIPFTDFDTDTLVKYKPYTAEKLFIITSQGNRYIKANQKKQMLDLSQRTLLPLPLIVKTIRIPETESQGKTTMSSVSEKNIHMTLKHTTHTRPTEPKIKFQSFELSTHTKG